MKSFAKRQRYAAKRTAAQKALAWVRRVWRESLYDKLRTENDGNVPCFVCGVHVQRGEATLEHIVPLSKGGSDSPSNHAISHRECNMRKSDSLIVHRATLEA